MEEVCSLVENTASSEPPSTVGVSIECVFAAKLGWMPNHLKVTCLILQNWQIQQEK